MTVLPTKRRVCDICGESKTEPEFTWRKSQIESICRLCARERNAARPRSFPSLTMDANRRANLWRLYKITPEEYDELRERQDYRCAICGIHESDCDTSRIGGRRRQDGSRSESSPLFVDHCHGRDAVRGLLCQKCNFAIGQFDDDPVRIRAAAEYVERDPILPIDRSRRRQKPARQIEALF